jgi:hypothetical protein
LQQLNCLVAPYFHEYSADNYSRADNDMGDVLFEVAEEVEGEHLSDEVGNAE